MHENSGNSVIYYAHYTEGGVNKTGLTVTITVYEVIRDGTKTEVVTDGACTEIGDGLYRYLLASGTVDAAAEYVAVFHTATDTVDAQDIPAMWVIDRAGTEKLDTGITLADDAITASKFDESTAFPLKSADTGATQVARVGADSDTLETLSDEIATVKAKTDLLDVSSVTVNSPISGTTITILRGDTLEVSISDLGSLASYVSLDFTVKGSKSDADTEALIRIRLNATGLADGLLVLNGATPSSADDGSIAITDAAAGDITITLAASCTDDLATGTYAYDVQLIEADEVSTLTSGKATVIADVTRAVA